jgi:hypothetical protein
MTGAAAPPASYRRSPVPFRRVESETVIVDPGTRQVHVLNRTGSRVWELLADRCSLAGLAQALAPSFAVAPEQLVGDLQRFLVELGAKGLVRVDEPAPGEAAR